MFKVILSIVSNEDNLVSIEQLKQVPFKALVKHFCNVNKSAKAIERKEGRVGIISLLASDGEKIGPFKMKIQFRILKLYRKDILSFQ